MKAFDGIRVLDLTHVLAGPFSTYQLAVLGADVIKIESTKTHDMNREIGPVESFNDSLMGSHYQAQAANKRSITINLKSEKGVEIFKELASKADVIVENFRTGAMERLGLGYRDIQAINPRIIYCSMTGFGQTGPKNKHAAFDNTIQAFSGIMHLNGTEEEAVLIGSPIIDYGTGMQAAFAISSALLRRERTGKGQYLDVAMLDVTLMLMSSTVLNANTTGKEPSRSRFSRTPFAGYGGYLTSDGEILMIGAVTPKQCEKMWLVLGRKDLAAEMVELRIPDIVNRAKQDEEIISKVLATKTANEWEKLFNKADLPAARVRTLTEALESEQIRSRSVIGSFPSKTANQDNLKPTLAGFVCSEDGPSISTSPPEYGEHTRLILADIGYSPEEIDTFSKQGIT